MHRGGGVAIRRTVGDRSCQAVATDLISVAGDSLWLDQTPIEGRCSRLLLEENSSSRRTYALETLVCPHPGLLNTAGCIRRHS